jgi:hypothetical protein
MSKFVFSKIHFWLLGLLILVVSSIAAPAQPCPGDRAMWIYQRPDVVRDADERAAVFDFADSHGISEFFLYVSFNCGPSGNTCTLDESYARDLRLFLKQAHDANIRVDALRDDAELALARNHNRARAIVQAIVEFNRAGAAGEQFDGLHLDVEPHTLAEYRRDAIGTIRQFLDMNAAVIDAMAGQDLSYGVDVVEFWYPYWDERGRFVDRPELLMDYAGTRNYPTMHLLNMVKAVTIMSYHQNPDITIRKTRYAMEYAAQPEIGAAVYVGVQTSPDRPANETFGRGTQSEMEQALCMISDAFANSDSFLGFAYFKYSSFRDMPE